MIRPTARRGSQPVHATLTKCLFVCAQTDSPRVICKNTDYRYVHCWLRCVRRRRRRRHRRRSRRSRRCRRCRRCRRHLTEDPSDRNSSVAGAVVVLHRSGPEGRIEIFRTPHPVKQVTERYVASALLQPRQRSRGKLGEVDRRVGLEERHPRQREFRPRLCRRSRRRCRLCC